MSSSEVDIGLEHISGVVFRGTVYLGQPLQPHSIDFDTGSPIFWTLTNVACAAENASCPISVPRYDASKSSDYKIIENGSSMTMKYGTGGITGWASSDRFCFDSTGENCF